METQWQTNGDAITICGQKPMLDNSIDRDQISYSANDVNSTNNNHPWKLKPAVVSQPSSILTFQDLA